MARLSQIRWLALFAALACGSTSRADQLPVLIQALGDANVRQGASAALVKLGDAAVPALRKSLASKEPDVRVWSAFTLGEIGPAAKSASGELVKALADSDQSLRSAAAQALGKIGTADAVPALAKALCDEHEPVRLHAVVALGQIGPASHPATKQLIAVLSDHSLRPAARGALIDIGPSTVDSLVEALDDDSIRFDVAAVLREVDPAEAEKIGLGKPTAADLPSLRTVLFDGTRQPDEHAAAAQSLATLGDEGFAVLIEAFSQPEIARAAAGAFSKAGPCAVSALADVLVHEQPEVRGSAADALGHMGPVAGCSAAGLCDLLKDKDRNVRYRAVRALHELGPKAKPAVGELTALILNAKELEPARQWAIKTLIVTLPETHDAVVKALVEASKEETNYGVRQLARQQLKKIDPDAAKAADIK